MNGSKLLLVSLTVFAFLISLSFSVIVGNARLADPDDPRIADIAKWAVEEINKKNAAIESDTRYGFIKIERVRAQVVAGINYYLTLSLYEQKSSADQSKYKLVCNIRVMEQSWMATKLRLLSDLEC